MYQFISPFGVKIFFISIIGFVSKFLTILMPLISKRIIDAITVNKNEIFFYKSIYYVTALLVLYFLLSTWYSYLSSKYFLDIEQL